MIHPSKNISQNNSHLEFLASNDPDCCAEYFIENQWVTASSSNYEINAFDQGFPVVVLHCPYGTNLNHDRIGANVLPTLA
jgi:hypothetical protein